MEDSFNDGIAYVYSRKNKESSFKSSVNVTTLDDLKFISKYFYKEETQRQQDVAFADSMDRNLSLKISIPYCNSIKSNHQIIIDHTLYSIFHVDPSRIKNKTYIYLERMRNIERYNTR